MLEACISFVVIVTLLTVLALTLAGMLIAVASGGRL